MCINVSELIVASIDMEKKNYIDIHKYVFLRGIIFLP